MAKANKAETRKAELKQSKSNCLLIDADLRVTGGEVTKDLVRVAVTVFALAETVEQRIEVVEVVLSVAAPLPAGGRGVGHLVWCPTVVGSERGECVATVGIEHLTHVGGSAIDIERDVLACLGGSALALVLCDLHHSNFAVVAHQRSLARRLLECKAHQEHSWDLVVLCGLVERPLVLCTGLEDVLGCGLVRADHLEVGQLDVRRVPDGGRVVLADATCKEVVLAVGVVIVSVG